MTRRGGLHRCVASIATAMAAGTLLASVARAQDGGLTEAAERPSYLQIGTTAPVAAPASDTGEQTPLMSLLDHTPVGPALENARIQLYGWIEGSYEYNFMRPANGVNNLRSFDLFQGNQAYLNQVDLNVERTVDYSPTRFDVGGHVELMYGTDAHYTHSYGLLDHENGANPLTPLRPGGLYSLDVLQAYVDLALPVGNGLRLRAGKFELFKPINPNQRLTYTSTFAYYNVLPYTLTGITAAYQFNDHLNLEAGIGRGWNDSFRDNNGAIDGFARLKWNITDTQVMTAGLIAGPELPHDNSHWTTVADATYSNRLTDQFTVLFDGFYGYQANPLVGTSPGSPVQSPFTTAPHSHANFYGVSGDIIYRVNDYVSATGRAEWFRDDGGYVTGESQNVYEVTVGLTITPFPADALGRNFKLRPEVRYDYSSGAVPLFFEHRAGSMRRDEVTAAIDAIFNF